MTTMILFTSSTLPHVEQAGGKALALIEMTAAGLPVPPGFVLTVQFFQPWLATLQASPEWRAITQGAVSELGGTARALQDACRTLRFTSRQKAALEDAVQALGTSSPGELYAVRSSSPEEDLEGASFAGGYETTLGVRAEALESAILHSFRSAFDERVFLYKREHGFRLDPPRIAVIVQQQVHAESAGVAFSLNPLNNCFDEAVINANHGLGESVVSGEADPDVFVVHKHQHTILETRLGRKQTRITLNETGGTHSIPGNPQAYSLTPAQVLELTAILEKVEAYYQKPVDIEWALAKERFYLLQARPITTYMPLPAEMITAPGEPKRLYANSTLIEQGVQEPLSVLGTDFLGYVLKQVGGPIGKDAVGLDGITFTAGGGYYMNLSYALKLGMGKAALAPGSIGDPRVMAILESIELRPYMGGKLPKRLRSLRSKMLFTMLPMAKSILEAYLRPGHFLQRYQAALPQALQRFEQVAGQELSLQDYAIAVCDLLPFFYSEYGIPMILAGQIAQQRIRRLFKQEANQVQDHLINLGISLPGNKTTEMGELMYALAASAEIEPYESAADFLSALESAWRGRLEQAPPPGTLSSSFVRDWEHFMTEFGMRCPGEIDVATPRLKEQPALLFEQIKAMSVAIRDRTGSLSFFEEARAKREAAFRALHGVALKKGKSQARALAKSYATWVMLGGHRETGKHYVIRVIGLFRSKALAWAQTLVAQGRLDAPEQIFDLTIADIDRARTDPALDLRAVARERTVLIDKIRRSKGVARIIDSRGKIYYPPPTATAEGAWSGVPISPGVVQGPVKVLRYAGEKPLLPGEILVARATDPGWTPLFIHAKGIILEIGGALQHGAVVAREYGIPCVSGVDNATDLLVDGQWVEVDGSHGSVRILGEVDEIQE